MIYITSDLHFGHNQDFIYKPRGFATVQEQDEAIIKNWNSIIKPTDEVIVLGDLIMNDQKKGEKNLAKLNGKIKYILGNHDTVNKCKIYDSLGFECLGYAYPLSYKKYNFYLTHYPTICDNYDAGKPLTRRVINLCGHSHTADKFADFDKGLIYHTELDAHNNYPILLDDIIADIKNKLNHEK